MSSIKALPSPPEGERIDTSKRLSAADIKISKSQNVAAQEQLDSAVAEVNDWQPKKLPLSGFPDQPAHGSSPPATIANVRHLLEQNGIGVGYNVIKKKLEISFPGLPLTSDNADNVAMTHIISLAAMHGMHTGQVPAYVDAIGDGKAYNPAANWIKSKKWDGKDRLPDIYATVTEREGYPAGLKCLLMYKWLLSIVAAALMIKGFRCRGVLTLQGGQGIGKTSWGRSLVSDPELCDSIVKVDHHLDGGSKDSMLTAIAHLIVEIGELESSFKRDISRLKGFLTADRDKVRRPYARGDSDYPRRTVFYATVNVFDFLLDATGNSRFWTIEVDDINFNHGIDMQQLFAQLAEDFAAGQGWWLTKEEEALLDEQNDRHRTTSFVQDQVLDVIEHDPPKDSRYDAMTATEVLSVAGIDRPTNPQAKECAALLRRLFGDPKRVKGRDRWRIPLRPDLDRSRVPVPPQPVKDPYD